MSKAIAEQSNALSIFWLKQNHSIPKSGWKSGTITWTFGWSENKSSVGYEFFVGGEEESYFRVHYTHTDSWDNKKTDMDYKIQLTTTPCNYGGKRFWFICPLSKNGKYCGRRVGVVYSIGKYFGCRHCGNIAYDAQKQSAKWRFGSANSADIDKLASEIKRYTYKGKPTRKYRRLLRMSEQLERGLLLATSSLDLKYGQRSKK